MVSLSGDLEPCLPASLLKFRHVRRKVDRLTAILQAGVGSLKLTLVAYPSARDIAFILSQWQLPAAGCSSQLFTMCCKLAHNFYFIPPFSWKFFLSHFIVSSPTFRLTSFILSPCSACPMFCFICGFLSRSLSTPLLLPSSSVSSMRPLNNQHHNSDKPPGCQLWFCFNSMLSDFQSHPFPERWTWHLCHYWLTLLLLFWLVVAAMGEVCTISLSPAWAIFATLQRCNNSPSMYCPVAKETARVRVGMWSPGVSCMQYLTAYMYVNETLLFSILFLWIGDGN